MLVDAVGEGESGADAESNINTCEECVRVLSPLSRVCVFATPWSIASQTPLSVELSRQEYWMGCRARLQGIFLTQGSNPRLLLFLHCQAGFGPLCLLRGPTLSYNPGLLWHSESTEHLRLQLGACGIRTDGAFAFRSLQMLLH